MAIFAYSVQANAVNKSAVVLLVAKDSAGEILGTGTGFIVKPEGILVTNYHVLLDAAIIQAVMSNGDKVQVNSILKVDRVKDFALLQLAEGAYSTLEIGDSNNLKEFDYLSAIGFLSENINSFQGFSAPNGKGNHKETVVQTFGFVLGIHPQAQENFNFIKPFLDTKERISLGDLLEADKSSKEAHYYRGNYYLYVKGDADRAITEFESVLKLDDSFVLAHYDLATAYQSQGFTERAIQEYEKAVSLNPSFPEGSSNLGGNYFRMQRYEKAEKLFKQAIDAYPNFIQAHSNLGAVLNKLISNCILQ